MRSSPGNIFRTRRSSTIKFLRKTQDFWPCSAVAKTRNFFVFADKQSFMQTYCISHEPKMLSHFDFDKFYLVSIHQGLCPTGGYRIRVKKFRQWKDKTEITIKFKQPTPEQMVTLAMTTPSIFFMVPRLAEERQPPLFRFRSVEGNVLAERIPKSSK